MLRFSRVTVMLPVQISNMRKRDKKKEKQLQDRMRQAMLQAQVQPSMRAQSLRVRQDSMQLIDTYAGARCCTSRDNERRRWGPALGSVVEVEQTAERTIISIGAASVPEMLQWIAPKLLRITRAQLAARGTGTQRGASVILTSSVSSSGPHKDGEDTLLLNVTGERQVWFAPPADVSSRIPRTQVHPGASTFLDSMYDPVAHPMQHGVKWHGPLRLHAGDAIFISRGWWHCIGSEAGGVAVPVEVVHGSISGYAPRIWRRVAPSKPRIDSSGERRMVSRRVQWGSAMDVERLFRSVLATME